MDALLWVERIQILGEDCILGISCDITDRKRAEEQLRRSEGLLRLVLDALPVGVAVVDRSGDIILSNPRRSGSGAISFSPDPSVMPGARAGGTTPVSLSRRINGLRPGSLGRRHRRQ